MVLTSVLARGPADHGMQLIQIVGLADDCDFSTTTGATCSLPKTYAQSDLVHPYRHRRSGPAPVSTSLFTSVRGSAEDLSSTYF